MFSRARSVTVIDQRSTLPGTLNLSGSDVQILATNTRRLVDRTRPTWTYGPTGGALEGAPLQLFTAYLADSFGSRAGAAKGLGGLRSGAGRDFEIENVNIPLPSPGRG